MSGLKFPVTGIGIISACGNNINETLISFQSLKRNGKKVSLFDSKIDCPVFEVNLKTSYKNMRTLDLALEAVKQAVEESKLLEVRENYRIGVCIGTTIASQLNDINFYREYRKSGEAPIDSVNRYLNSNLADAISKYYNFDGPKCTVANACSSGTDAIGIGLSWLKADMCDIVICGGADELNIVPLSGFFSLGVMSDELCKPFDKNRKGLNLGEGAGIIVIEKEEISKKRNMKSKFYVNGYGLSCDAYHLTAPRPDGSGLSKAILKALEEAEIKPEDISFINAHGTSTIDNDKTEGLVFKNLFGGKIDFLSTKGYTGHTLGAAGGIEAVFTILGLKEGWIPASIGFENIDETIGLEPTRERREVKGKYALSTSLAFGGNNSALIFSRE
ncbi:MAG: beta-ketoacyl-[acyl-carrier-protein] synthase family protein [Brevinematales bacterium]